MWSRTRIVLIVAVVSLMAFLSTALAQRTRVTPTIRRPVLTVAPTPAVQPRALYFSTEEDFITRGSTPSDGNRIVSDGDLLTATGQVFRRNSELLLAFGLRDDLGLDAADVVWLDTDARRSQIAFSTELDDPEGRFTAGDLLTTDGGVLPNAALLAAFNLPTKVDLGLDAVHFIGRPDVIRRFLGEIKSRGHGYWMENPSGLAERLRALKIDIWFSTEGTAPTVKAPKFIDGDLLAATGSIIARNGVLLPNTVPAGIPDRGVDFGLDAVLSDRSGKREPIVYSTEILYTGQVNFTDGDVLRINNGVLVRNPDLVRPFKPKASFLGLDALSIKPQK